MVVDPNPVVYVVDDDPSIRRALERLLRSSGREVETFASAAEFLEVHRGETHGCLVLDVNLPGTSGLELQRELAEAALRIPIIFITGHGDIPMSVRAMKAGAVDFLAKPFDDTELLRAVEAAIDRDRTERQADEEQTEVRGRIASLTARERQVFEQVVRGKLNKQIAFDLGISEKTVKVHRARVMEKMRADSLADLVRMAERCGTGK
jgi:RNA polymerase sigma factor (sigma-70 family)